MTKFSLFTADAGREILNSVRNDRTPPPVSGEMDTIISNYIVTVEITQDWTQASGNTHYSAMAKRVVFDGGSFSLEGNEFPVCYPGTTGKPTQAVGDRVTVAYRGRWEIIGGGGGGGASPSTLDTLTITQTTITNTAPGIVDRIHGETSTNLINVYGDMLTSFQSIPSGTLVLVGKVMTRYQSGQTYLYAERYQVKEARNLTYQPVFLAPTISTLSSNVSTITRASTTTTNSMRIEIFQNNILVATRTNATSPDTVALQAAPGTTVMIRAYSNAYGEFAASPFATRTFPNMRYN